MNLTGTWLGTYWQHDQPTRFEATFSQGGSALSGRISDDGYLGDAQIAGQVAGRAVRFNKRYLKTEYVIKYTGIISEDGNHIQGEWFISSHESGPWEAYRSEETLMFPGVEMASVASSVDVT